ncbi:MAG: hypothetical protein KDD58_04920, partial [Bdellovibrionales bacterium]|nr:hypothetical protein [Bdellovibrionales bacterium]
MRTFLRQFLAFLILSFRRIWKNSGFILRALIVLIIGLFFLWISIQQNYDLRFKLRSLNQPTSEIVIIEISPADVLSWGQNPDSILQFSENPSFQDYQYWNLEIWQNFLETLIELSPRSVGVNLF